MPKEKLTLSVDKEVVEKAKNLGINISEITERVLKGYTSAEKPAGSIHDAYRDLFDSIQQLLEEFDCNVKVAESWFEIVDDAGEVERVALKDESYLTGSGSFLIQSGMSPEHYYVQDIKKIPADEFLTPEKILSNLVNELAESQEKRKEKMDEILMAKSIIDAISESLLRQSKKEK